MERAEKLVHYCTVKSFECDRRDELRLVTLFHMFQDIADESTARMGIGYDYLRSIGKAWVIISMNVEIERMPRLAEEIKVVSWPSGEQGIYTEREYEVWSASGKRIIRACSQWIVIDYVSRHPVSARKYLPEYEAVQEKAVAENRFCKLPAIGQEDYSEQFLVRYDDIDHNNHVNNAVYALWASESLPPEFRINHTPAHVEINFRKEGLFGEKIIVKTQMAHTRSMHSIVAATDDRELSRIRFEWRPDNNH